MNRQNLSDMLLLHLIVIILGFTAIFGKLISLPAYELVWYRMLIALGALSVMLLFAGKSFRLPLKDITRLCGIGIIIATHWICFFYAIKVSNVSVTLGCLSVTTLFTSFIEPLVQKRKISLVEVIIGLLIILGIYIIFRFETRYFEGIVFSLLAALFASIFSVLNKQVSLKYDARVISFYEMLSGFAAITVFMLLSRDFNDIQFSMSLYDLIFLLLLGIVCTAWAFAATIRIMQRLSAYQVVLAINLEPVYGIVLAWVIFGQSEQMTAGFYAGAAIIIVSVFMYPVLKKVVYRL